MDLGTNLGSGGGGHMPIRVSHIQQATLGGAWTGLQERRSPSQHEAAQRIKERSHHPERERQEHSQREGANMCK